MPREETKETAARGRRLLFMKIPGGSDDPARRTLRCLRRRGGCATRPAERRAQRLAPLRKIKNYFGLAFQIVVMRMPPNRAKAERLIIQPLQPK